MNPDDDIRHGLRSLAGSVQSAPPDISTVQHIRTVGPPRGLRRQLPLAAAAIGGLALVGVGGAAAAGVFRSDTTTFVEAVCGLDTSEARNVASGTDDLGAEVTLWVLSRPIGDAAVLAVQDPSGQWNYDTAACGPWPGGAQRPDGQPWAADPSLTIDNQAIYLRVYGWIPQPATTAVLTFADGTTVTAAAGDDGYFLQLITTSSPDGATLERLVALAPDGSSVAEHDVP